MAHAKPEHLKDLNILLSDIRKNSFLKEKSLGCFYFKSKSVLHFHIKAERLCAHVYNGKDWIEVDLKVPLAATEQKRLGKTITNLLPITT